MSRSHNQLRSLESPRLRVGLAGFGNVGRDVAARLIAGEVPEVELVAVTASDLDKARQTASTYDPPPQVLTLAEVSELCDVVVECATADSFPEIARAVLETGKDLIALSASGVLETPEMWDLARQHGGRVRIASGTLPGLDMIRCAAEGNINSVHLKAHIIASSLAREPYILEQGFDFSQPPAAPVEVFSGSVSEAARAFPRHFNVAISLGLAGIGLDLTTIEVIADGDIPGNIIHAEVEAQDIGLTLISRNRPSDNPRTSRIVALNIIAILRSMVSPVVVGS